MEWFCARRALWATAVRGRILLFGGYTNDYSADVFEFDPKTQVTVKIGPLPHALADGKFILLGRRILTAGDPRIMQFAFKYDF